MRPKTTRMISRTAMMLLTLVLAFAAQTVRADNVKVNINGIGTVALTHGGIRTEYYPDAAKMKKQMSYANAKQIPFVVLAGETEMAEGKFTLKDMNTGEQQMLTVEEIINRLQ